MQNVADPEIVVGIVGRMGVDTRRVVGWLSDSLHSMHYQPHHIKITDYLKTKSFDFTVNESTIEDRYESYISGCNAIREAARRNDFFASYAIQRIIDIRSSSELGSGDPAIPAERVAYIIDQIKRPEEADALRSVYGQQFILVSCHIPRDLRVQTLAQKIAEGHASVPKAEKWQAIARDLIDRDENESSKPFGQRVSDVFPKADLVIDARNEKTASPTLTRFFEALFGNFKVSPTRAEFFQNIAYQVSLTSCDTARQVGAAVERDGEILAVGYNEAPKAQGGTYWAEDGLDARDVALGKDANTVRKRQMVADIVRRLRDSGALRDGEIADHEIEAKFIDGDGPLKKSQIMDTLEYGRAVHAEMAVISSLARKGVAVQGGSLYCTTFPCHNCAKHIVASGIKNVYYLEPYEKSFADDLYPDSIAIDSSLDDQELVKFNQFIGITPNRFSQLFAKEKLKDEKGYVIEWSKKSAQPILGKLDQNHIDREVVFQRALLDSIDPNFTSYLGLESSERG